MKKQLLIIAIVGLIFALGAGPLVAQSGASDTTKAATPAATPAAAPAATKAAGPPPTKGMVWVNTDSGVYHKEGSRYYGKTKEGKYMTEADAKKAGYKASKSGN